MKKAALLLYILLFALCFTGCAAQSQPPAEPSVTEDPWGIALSVRDGTPTGCILVCTQSGGSPTGELMTGTPYQLQVWKDGQWQEVEETPSEYERAWTSEAWLITMGGTTEWEVNWEWLYGTLPAGTYRISKTIMDFRGTGDYDERAYYAQFEIPG